ncbi:ankyrin repeat-containing domain protein [Aspergillus karnatakaensis]|uniref:ankyrin repeat domain-containing protein n=1 Tax=Aspergillus karnatakaensis TaxID=1810916 RepID=UPI003CCCC100
MSQSNFEALPTELILDITELLNVEDLTAFIRTSKRAWNVGSKRQATFATSDVEAAFQNAAQNDKPEVMLRLLPLLRRAGLDVQWYCIETLACACRADDIESIMFLLNEGVPYDPPRGPPGWHVWWKVGSPLLCALKAEKPGALLALIDAGADLDVLTRGQRHPSESLLQHAAKAGYSALVHVLIFPDATLDVNNRDQAMKFAAKHGHKHIVTLLLSQNADLKATDDRGRTPLHWAAANRRDEVVKMLLANGAPLESADMYGDTPLQTAIRKRRRKAVDRLIQQGANVNHQNKQGRTPLSLAAGLAMCKGLMASALIAAGANLDTPDANGRTPLSHAYEYHAPSAVKILVDAGANTEVLDAKGRPVGAYYRPGSFHATMRYVDEADELKNMGLYFASDPMHPDLRLHIPAEDDEEIWSDVDWEDVEEL